MTAFDDLPALDTERLMNDLYAMQVSFSMIFAQLARTRPQDWDRELLDSLLVLHKVLMRDMPSLKRH